MGMGRHRLPPVPGVRGVPVPGVLRGVLRAEVQDAARRFLRYRPGRVPGYVPQLGLPDPPADLQRLPLCPRSPTRGSHLTVCRHLGYLGPPIPLSTVLFEPPHSLAHPSFAPKDMRRGGTLNADGLRLASDPPRAQPVPHPPPC